MPVLVRRQPSLDLRRAAKVHDAVLHYGRDSWSSVDDFTVLNSPKRTPGRHSLRLVTSSPVLHHQYQSDEESASPEDDDDAASGCADDLPLPAAPADATPQAATAPAPNVTLDEANASESEYEDDIDLSDEDDEDADEEATPLQPFPRVIAASALAIAVPILAVGRPRVVSVSALAPPQKRQTAVTQRPPTRLAASLAAMRRFRAPAPVEIVSPTRSSAPAPALAAEEPDNDAASFTTAASSSGPAREDAPSLPDRIDSLTPPDSLTRPGTAVSASASSTASDSLAGTDDAAVPSSKTSLDEEPSSAAAAVDLAEVTPRPRTQLTASPAARFQQRPFMPSSSSSRRGSASTHGSSIAADGAKIEEHRAPTPTRYAEYDPFALEPPTLRAASVASPPESPRFKRWMAGGWGLAGGRRNVLRKGQRRWGAVGQEGVAA